jgi:hypothetical protein
MTTFDDRDLFDDEDLLDFEDPANRDLARQRMQVTTPPTVSAARIVMYLQAASPILLPFVLIATRGGGGDSASPATTTTTVPAIGAGGAAGGGGGGGVFLIIFVLFLALIAGLVVVASRLPKLSASVRTQALTVEGLLLLAGLGLALRGSVPGIALVVSAGAVIGLLLAPATKRAIARATSTDAVARFDVRNLPGLDR